MNGVESVAAKSWVRLRCRLVLALGLAGFGLGIGGAARAEMSGDDLVAFRSTRAQCTAAASEAMARAEAAGVARERMQFLYGRKPFSAVGHISLVIDGWVVDNGGLGRDLWGQPVCPGNVCRLDEARRALDQSFLEPADAVPRTAFDAGDWQVRVAAAPR